VTPGGLVYLVLNRSVAGLPLIRKRADYEAFERITIEAHGRHPMQILAWCLMRTHWHFMVWPRGSQRIGLSETPTRTNPPATPQARLLPASPNLLLLLPVSSAFRGYGGAHCSISLPYFGTFRAAVIVGDGEVRMARWILR
jgi:hypothetical protein